jgi:1-acyl-sn-glycerol-3-phosphate acyltransferase
MQDPAAHSLPERDAALLGRLAELADAVIRPYFRAEIRGVDRIPRGAALLVGNHNAGLLAPEAFLLFAALRHRALVDVPYALTGDLVVMVPALERAAARLGIVRARPEVALGLLAGGAKVLVYPGGDVESMRPYVDRDRIVFGGRRGYVRLAVRAGVPIVPVVAAGAHSTFVVLSDGRRFLEALGIGSRLRLTTWPISLCLPWGVAIGPAQLHLPWPTRILEEVLPPIHFERSGEAAASDAEYVRACAEQVESTMQAALTRLARERASR